jgi:CheY-like chemotaxis protein
MEPSRFRTVPDSSCALCAVPYRSRRIYSADLWVHGFPTPGGSGRDTVKGVAFVRILIADDYADLAASMALLMELDGHEVKVARDGEEAVEAVGPFCPDVVILDIGMPRMNGYQAAQEMKKLSANPPVLIAHTAWGDEDTKRRGKEAGFDYFLVKPATAEALQQVLLTCL